MSNEGLKQWYAEGLHFSCTQCGQCCTGAPGYAWVSDEEIEAIANYLHIPLEKFYKRYLRYVKDSYALKEDSRNYDCIFLKDKKCQIYPVRPKQCRTFPWWTQNLQSREDWDKAARFCEGIRNEAPLVSYETIQEQLTIQNKNDDL